MFRLSGMNHSIGGWQIRSENKGQTFVGMLYSIFDDAYIKRGFNNIDQLLNIATVDTAEGCYFYC